MRAAEVDGEALGQVLGRKRRDGDHLGLEIVERLAEAIEVGRIRQQGEVEVAAKLRCAV